MRNVEIKAKVRDLKSLLRKAKLLSQSEGEKIIQHDIFYNSPNGRLKLRIFEDNASELIYYDRPDAEGPKLSSYNKTNLPEISTSDLKTVLLRALGQKQEVKKTRMLFMVGQTRIHVDSVENLGDFMELEVGLRPEETPDDGEKIANDLMDKLGVGKEDLLAGAYADMLAKKM